MRIRDLFKIKKLPKDKRPYKVSIYVSHSKSFLDKSFRKPEQALRYVINYAKDHKPDIEMTKKIMGYDFKYLDFNNLLVSSDNWKPYAGYALELNYISIGHIVVMIIIWPRKSFLKFLS